MEKFIKLLSLTSFSVSLILLVSCKDQEIKEDVEIFQTNFVLKDYQSTGVDFVNKIQDAPQMNILFYEYYHNGAGVGVGDFDNDGLIDLYFVGNFGKNHLYRNLGNFRFQDITDSSNSAGSFGWSTGVSIIDINNDGLLDIYLSKSGNFDEASRRNELLINLGNLKFENQAAQYGLDDNGYSNQAAFFDYDKDGDLDAYILNHPFNPQENLDIKKLSFKEDPFGSDHLYENKDGKFYDVSKKAGIINNSIGFGLSVSIGDMNNDSYPDIYVTNDYMERDYYYINNQDGTFKEDLINSFRHISNFSMGSDIADINNDGYLDLFVADMAAEDNYRSKTNMSGMNPEKFYLAVDNGKHYQYMINTLQINNSNNTFSEVSQMAGVDKTDWSWAPLFADFDNDGRKDLYITNGLRKEARNNDFIKLKKEMFMDFATKSQKERLRLIQELIGMMPEQRIANYMYRNSDDLAFENVGEKWGMESLSFSNGAAYADLDNDGDLDLLVNNIDQAAFVYENKSQGNNYIDIILNGSKLNKNGIGARISISCQGTNQMSEQYLARGYLSSIDQKVHFGLGKAGSVDELKIIWADGKEQNLRDLKANQTITLNYEEANNVQPIPFENKALFTKVNDDYNLNIKHLENEFDDYKKQVLLPHKMSQLGPACSIGDVNGDGLDDIFIGGSSGFAGAIYTQSQNGSFQKMQTSVFEKEKNKEDIASIFFDMDNDGDNDLYVVSGGNEFEIGSENYADRLYENLGNGSFKNASSVLPDVKVSGGSVIAKDLNADGFLDLFVGGRQVPGKYPSPSDSYILYNLNGKFQMSDLKKDVAFQNLGMVSDACFLDYNEDGMTDILVVGEWMPVTIITQSAKGFDNKIEIPESRGWWNCIREIDINGNGKKDYILGNLGLNVKYKASTDAPFHIYAKDFDSNDHFDIVLSNTIGNKMFPVRGRQCSSEQLPEIKDKFPSYDLFAKATTDEIYSPQELSTALHYEANNFKTSILYNNGKENFDLVALPRVAQISSTKSILSEDFNGDGILDLLLVGNMEEMEVETPRLDASYGILLLQDEKGNFSKSDKRMNLSGNVRHISKISINENPHYVLVRNSGDINLLKPTHKTNIK